MNEQEDDYKIVRYLFIIAFIILLATVCYILSGIFNKAFVVDTDATELNWDVNETIKFTYEQCKDLNRHQPIKRLFKQDYMLPMCPKAYVVLYDEHQEIVFIFNEELQDNPSILTISVACDNTTGQCS